MARGALNERATIAVVLISLLALMACGEEADERDRGPLVIQQARAAHGSHVLDDSVVEFAFRESHYRIERRSGLFSYVRRYEDDEGRKVQDILDNDGVRRMIDREEVPLTERERQSVETAVNSVVYFALLPYNLADDAVRATWQGVDTIRGRVYDRVEVTFEQEGGGRDWEDRFLYWFSVDTHDMDFLAYDFHTGDGGTRFREAINHRVVGGVRFVDYINFSGDRDSELARLEEYPRMLEISSLDTVSIVRLDGVVVHP